MQSRCGTHQAKRIEIFPQIDNVRRHLEPGQRAAVAVEAKPLLAAEAKRNQMKAGASNLSKHKGKLSSLKNEMTNKPLQSVEKSVAKQFDVSQGYV